MRTPDGFLAPQEPTSACATSRRPYETPRLERHGSYLTVTGSLSEIVIRLGLPEDER